MNKIYLFKPVSILGRIISFITRSKYSHAAIEIEGTLYDSSEQRGYFSYSNIDTNKRQHIYYDIDGDLTDWVRDMHFTPYDWVGIFGWLFAADDKKKFYCFEAVYSAMKHLDETVEDKNQVSAKTIINFFEQRGISWH